MHWMRVVVAPSMVRAIARASTVFAVPGTSSSSTCPPHVSAASTSLISSRLAVDDRLDVREEAIGDLDRAVERRLGLERGCLDSIGLDSTQGSSLETRARPVCLLL